MKTTRVRVVHGFGVISAVFRPLLFNLKSRSLDASLFRYPSVGLPLQIIVERLAKDLADHRPDGIIAHSLGCVATILAVNEVGWQGPIVLLAPPFTRIPMTSLIPSRFMGPFQPLIDHRALVSSSKFTFPKLHGCRTMAIVGRFDFTVPSHCSRGYDVDAFFTVGHSHNTLLWSPRVALMCLDWIRSL